MKNEPCELSDLLCGVVATCYVDEDGEPIGTGENGDVSLDTSLEHPYWCGMCSKEFENREEALEHVKTEETQA